MMASSLAGMTPEDLIRQFEKVAIAQHQAIELDDNAEFGRLFRRMAEIVNELRQRGQLLSLMQLYSHSNPQVRLKAARHTLYTAPQAARPVLQALVTGKWYPQAMDAGFALDTYDKRIIEPS